LSVMVHYKSWSWN